MIRSFDTERWNEEVRGFLEAYGSLLTIYSRSRTVNLVPVRLPNGDILQLSPGKHNRVQAAVIEQFAPRFAQGALPLYLGDTAKKALYVDAARLASLDIPVTEHGKLPDIVLYEAERNWLFLIEAVTSHGPMSPKRLVELQELLQDCQAGRVFVSAFPDLREFRRHLRDIAWETEVWIMEMPDHLIHFNGDRFLGPR